MALFSYIFGVFVAVISYLMYQNYVHKHTSLIKRPDKRYDYIIVGAGTAGCVLASRLTEDPRIKVLLVEAGDQMGYFATIPLTATAAQLGPNDWSVRSTPQKYSSFGLWNQTQILPRGKGLGGSNQINFLLHGYGLKKDYERWSQLGLKGWNFEDLKPYLKKAFGSTASQFDSRFGVKKAKINLQMPNYKNELMNTFLEASKEVNGKNIQFRKPTATLKNGKRDSAFESYLRPALNRKNLHVLIRTQAVLIRFEDRAAKSLYILQNHLELNNIFVKKEIIISAGTIKTPQLLMLSGIGPKEVLQKLKINPILINGDVGRNFHDHMNLPIYVSITKPISTTLSKVFTFNTVWEYLTKGKGFLAFPPVAGIEYQNSSALILFSMGTASERLLRDLSNYRPQVFRDTFPFLNQTGKEGFMFLATCLQPRSRGYVTVDDFKIITPPIVNPNYLFDERDVPCMIEAVRRAEQLIKSRTFQRIGAKIHWPRPERCLTFWMTTKEDQTNYVRRKRNRSKATSTASTGSGSPPDAFIECVIREIAVTGHHAGGTCAGGRVVDEELRLKSISKVRIVDASVFPSPISLFPNSVLIAMAERAADIIKKTIN